MTINTMTKNGMSVNPKAHINSKVIRKSKSMVAINCNIERGIAISYSSGTKEKNKGRKRLQHKGKLKKGHKNKIIL